MKNIDWQYLYLNYEGRISRSYWWLGMLGLLIVSGIASLLFGYDGIIAWLIGLALLYPALCVHIKRCHDRDQSGWWCLLLLIPVVGFLWALINLGILEGTRGENRFGPDPLAAA